MKETPEISVIMSVYNGEEYLAEALDSICAQSFEEWELIVINDCSSDNTQTVLDKYVKLDRRIKVYCNEVNLKLPASLNKAVSLAQGKYIVRMDADDICLPDRLEKQYYFMEKHTDVILSSCRFMTLRDGIVSSGGGGGKGDPESIKALLLVTNPLLHPGVIAKKEFMQKLKYDTGLTCTEDLELWTRAAKQNYKMAIQDAYLMLYRIHNKQITETTLERQYKEVLKIQKKYCPELFESMDTEQEKFYIHGIYFRENMDIECFSEFYRRVKTLNKELGFFDSEALDYAFFEILAEYKRCGTSSGGIFKGMLNFKITFLVKELFARKQRARNDGRKCIEAAEKIGLKHSGGSCEFPRFSRVRD